MMGMRWSISHESDNTDLNQPQGRIQLHNQSHGGRKCSQIKQLVPARKQRLSIGTQSNIGHGRKWIIIYLLTLMPNISIGAMHCANHQTATTAIDLWLICTALAFSMISLHIHPFKVFGAFSPTLSGQH